MSESEAVFREKTAIAAMQSLIIAILGTEGDEAFMMAKAVYGERNKWK